MRSVVFCIFTHQVILRICYIFICTHHSISKTVDLTDAKLWAYKDHSFNIGILKEFSLSVITIIIILMTLGVRDDFKNKNFLENVAILGEKVNQLNLRRNLERKILLEMREGR